MRALDLSFSAASLAWCQARRSEGWGLLIPDLWTGVSTPAPARANLVNARAAGMLTAGYTVVNSLPAATAVNKAVGAAGPEWEHLNFIAVDVEVETTPATVRQAVDGLRALGKKVCIYTGAWFWNWFQLQFGGNFDFSDVPAWLADYDGNPALDTPRLGRLGPVSGKQYRGSHDIGGVTVDANTFDDSFIQEEDTMFTVIKGSGPAQYIFTGSSRWWIRSGAFRAELEALGLIGPGFLQVSDDLLNTIPEVQTAGGPIDIAAIAQAVRALFKTDPLK